MIKNYIGEHSYLDENQEFSDNLLGIVYVPGFCGNTFDEMVEDVKDAMEDHIKDLKR